MKTVNNIKKIGLVIALATVAVTASAKDNGRGDRNGDPMDRIAEALELSEEQVTQIQELMTSLRGDRVSREEAIQEARKEQKEKIELELQRILTDEQFSQYQEFSDRGRGGKGNRRGGRGSKGGNRS